MKFVGSNETEYYQVQNKYGGLIRLVGTPVYADTIMDEETAKFLEKKLGGEAKEIK